MIPFNPNLDNITPVHTILELNRPWGVGVTDDGHIIVSEFNGDCVKILDKNGKKIKSFGQKIIRSGNVKFDCPHGVAITSENFILVADNYKIQKISMDGKCIASVGKQGSGLLEFNQPCGITISPMFCTKGSANGQFDCPRDVAINKQELMLLIVGIIVFRNSLLTDNFCLSLVLMGLILDS